MVAGGLCEAAVSKERSMFSRVDLLARVAAIGAVAAVAHGDYYQFSGSLTNGYSVQGVFQTKATAPVSFIESNPNFPNAPFLTQYIESASLSVSLLGSTVGVGSPVVGGVSYEQYFYAAFNSSTLSLSAFDLQARNPGAGSTPYYFISNGVAPDGTAVAYGSTAFNLFLFNPNGSVYTFLGSTGGLGVTAIPAPASVLAFALLPMGRRRRR